MAMHTRQPEWFDDDSFWQALQPLMFNERKLAAAADEVQHLLALTSPPGTRSLDLCCGLGRIAIPLAQAGHHVTGVDQSRWLLTEARSNAAHAEVEVEWVRSDMRDFVRAEAFDFALNMFTSFGYFADQREDLTVLRNLWTSLKPGGVLIMDLMGKEVLARVFSTITEDVMDDAHVFQRHVINHDWTRVSNEWIVVQDDRARTFRFEHTVYSGEELRERLKEAGFVDIRLYGDLDGRPYDHRARRLVAVARRPHGRSTNT